MLLCVIRLKPFSNIVPLSEKCSHMFMHRIFWKRIFQESVLRLSGIATSTVRASESRQSFLILIYSNIWHATSYSRLTPPLIMMIKRNFIPKIRLLSSHSLVAVQTLRNRVYRFSAPMREITCMLCVIQQTHANRRLALKPQYAFGIKIAKPLLFRFLYCNYVAVAIEKCVQKHIV